MRLFLAMLVGVAALCAFELPKPASGCPFCTATQSTLSEDLRSMDVSVICRLLRPGVEGREAEFEVLETLRGGEHLPKAADGVSPLPVKIIYFGEEPVGTTFLAFAIDPTNLAWGTPTPLSQAALQYVRRLPGLPSADNERLLFFLDYLEAEDNLLAADVYDEFAKASYADLVSIRAALPREKLLTWIDSPTTATARRRQYLCMLSVCGTPEDLRTLERWIRKDDRTLRLALDAMIGAYLALRGEAGLKLVEEMFLANPAAEYTDTYSAIMALRFILSDTSAMPKSRVVRSLRLLLQRPQLADLIIPDLSRAEDWESLPQVVRLFDSANGPDQTLWVRVPAVNFVRACPLPEAKKELERFATVDPDAVARAKQFYGSSVPSTSEKTPNGDR